jgi:hypothetical protein
MRSCERQDGTTVDLTLALDKKRRIDTAFEVYLGLYQAITGPEERQKFYKEFSPGFFDLIVIVPSRQRGEDSAWREILTLFSGATQIEFSPIRRSRDQRRLPRALKGHQGSYRPRRGRLSPGTRTARPRRQRGRGPLYNAKRGARRASQEPRPASRTPRVLSLSGEANRRQVRRAGRAGTPS